MAKIIRNEHGTVHCHLDKNCRACVVDCTTMLVECLEEMEKGTLADYESYLKWITYDIKKRILHIWP